MVDWKTNPKPKIPKSFEEILDGLEKVKGFLENQIEADLKELDKAQAELVKLEKRKKGKEEK